MFERYTERARRVLFFARYEASQLGAASIGPEHVLLGLLREPQGAASLVLAQFDATLPGAILELQERAATGTRTPTSGEMPLTDAAKAALRAAIGEADRLGKGHVDTEHVLLGLLGNPASEAGVVLLGVGLDLAGARARLASLTAADGAPAAHVVLVVVVIREALATEFEAALLHNARESLLKDKGCRRFDVSQDKETPTVWVLHEVYDRVEDHVAHRLSPHFLAYDAVAKRAVTEKTVLRCHARHVPLGGPAET